jgi:RNA polymerase sigma-70 factor (ECF subfamily)
LAITGAIQVTLFSLNIFPTLFDSGDVLSFETHESAAIFHIIALGLMHGRRGHVTGRATRRSPGIRQSGPALGKPIYRLCVRMTGDLHRAEDLKQETFLRLFEKRKDYAPKGRFSTYLWRIALNLCYDELRRRQRRQESLRDPLEDEADHGLEQRPADSPGPDTRTADREEGELVRQTLLQLPEIYRTVLVLRHYEDLKLARIAEILEIPQGTVNSRMAEALRRLSGLLESKLHPKPAGQAVPISLPKEATWRLDGEHCGWAPPPPGVCFDVSGGFLVNGRQSCQRLRFAIGLPPL